MSGVLATLGAQVAGGAAAVFVDHNFPQYEKEIAGVTITPGTMLGVGLAVGVGLIGGKIPVGVRTVIANAAGGMIVYEGTKIAEDKVLPLLNGVAPSSNPAMTPGGVPAAAMGYGRGGYGYPQVGCAPSYATDVSVGGALARIKNSFDAR